MTKNDKEQSEKISRIRRNMELADNVIQNIEIINHTHHVYYTRLNKLSKEQVDFMGQRNVTVLHNKRQIADHAILHL